MPSMLAIAFDPAGPAESPSDRFATPTATPARFKLASAAASPTRAGAVATAAMLLARFILRVYARRAPRRAPMGPSRCDDSWQTPGRLLATSSQGLHNDYKGNVQHQGRRKLTS